MTAVHEAPSDYPGGKKGDVLTVEFTVAGIPCPGLNAVPTFKHNEALSFQIATDNQEETDRYWNGIVSNGVSWQITSRTRMARYGGDRGPGCAAGVLLRGRVVFEGTAGAMDGHHRLTASTPVYLASVSKQFTAAAVYTLINRGKIDPDQPVRTILPELPGNTAGITIRHLLPPSLDSPGVPGTDYEYSNSDYVLLGMVIERVTGAPPGEL